MRADDYFHLATVICRRFPKGPERDALMLVTSPLGPRAWAAEQLPTLVGTVTKVVDGDTIDVQLASGSIRVRFHGIDTAEQDRHERMIWIVFVDGVNVNAELVRGGHAWAFRKYMRRSDAQLCADEAVARIGRRGLWALPKDQLSHRGNGDIQRPAGCPAGLSGRRTCRARPADGGLGLNIWPVPRIGLARTGGLNFLSAQTQATAL